MPTRKVSTFTGVILCGLLGAAACGPMSDPSEQTTGAPASASGNPQNGSDPQAPSGGRVISSASTGLTGGSTGGAPSGSSGTTTGGASSGSSDTTTGGTNAGGSTTGGTTTGGTTGANACTPDTWENYAMAFFSTWCSSCHSSSFTNLGTVQMQQADITSRIQSKSMPRGATLPASDYERILKWFSCGLPD